MTDKKQGSGVSNVKVNNNQNRNKKRRYYNNKNNNNNNSAQNKESNIKPPRVNHNINNKNRPETFTELSYTDKVIFVLGVVTVLMSITMWFMGYREEATYIGIWVPGIFSSGTFIRMAFSRAKRK
jgi:hypothetical protein